MQIGCRAKRQLSWAQNGQPAAKQRVKWHPSARNNTSIPVKTMTLVTDLPPPAEAHSRMSRFAAWPCSCFASCALEGPCGLASGDTAMAGKFVIDDDEVDDADSHGRDNTLGACMAIALGTGTEFPLNSSPLPAQGCTENNPSDRLAIAQFNIFINVGIPYAAFNGDLLARHS